MKLPLLSLLTIWVCSCGAQAQQQPPDVVSPRCRLARDGSSLECYKINYNYNGYALSPSNGLATPANPILVDVTYSDSTGIYATTSTSFTGSSAKFFGQRANLPRQYDSITFSNCRQGGSNGIKFRCSGILTKSELPVDCYNAPDGIIDCFNHSSVVAIPSIAQIWMTYGDDDVTLTYTKDRGATGSTPTLEDFQNSNSYYQNIDVTDVILHWYTGHCTINGVRQTCSEVFNIRYVDAGANGQPPAPPLPLVKGCSKKVGEYCGVTQRYKCCDGENVPGLGCNANGVCSLCGAEGATCGFDSSNPTPCCAGFACENNQCVPGTCLQTGESCSQGSGCCGTMQCQNYRGNQVCRPQLPACVAAGSNDRVPCSGLTLARDLCCSNLCTASPYNSRSGFNGTCAPSSLLAGTGVCKTDSDCGPLFICNVNYRCSLGLTTTGTGTLSDGSLVQDVGDPLSQVVNTLGDTVLN